MCYIAPLALPSCLWKRNEAKYFMLVYALVAMYFSRKMNRLVLLLSPAASVLGGIAIAGIVEWSLWQFWELATIALSFFTESGGGAASGAAALKNDEASGVAATATTDSAMKENKKKDKKTKTAATAASGLSGTTAGVSEGTVGGVFAQAKAVIQRVYNKSQLIRVIVGGGCVYLLATGVSGFWDHSTKMSVMLSNPSIILQVDIQYLGSSYSSG